MQKGNLQFEGYAGEDAEEHEDEVAKNLSGMNSLEQGLSTELWDVREEISDINTKLIKVQSYT
jgi:hypothetical protein